MSTAYRLSPALAALTLLTATLAVGCGHSDDGIVNGPVVVEAVVVGTVEDSKGAPVKGVSLQIEAWSGECGQGEPILPSETGSQLLTDSAGHYHARIREEADPFDACLTVQAEPQPVLHLLAGADTGATVSPRAPESIPDTAFEDFALEPDRPVLYAGISAESYRTCALSTRGAAFCWGHVGIGNVSGILYFDSSAAPLAVPGAAAFTAIDPSSGHGCGITPAGAAYCWGANEVGQLGDGTPRGSATPVAVHGDHVFVEITTGGTGFSCGVTTAGQGFCFGNNFIGQLGAGSDSPLSAVPVAVAGGLNFVDTDAGGAFVCGLTDTGAAYCWGSNGAGSLGDGTTTDRWSPVAVAGGLVLVEVAAGSWHTCATTADEKTYCWGANSSGQLGDGTTIQATTPVEVHGGIRFVALATGGLHTCGLTEVGQTYCWGNNERGQLGDGTRVDRHSPTPMTTGLRFVELAAGMYHTCGLDNTGAVYCWGSGQHGQLGIGTVGEDHVTPVAAAQPE